MHIYGHPVYIKKNSNEHWCRNAKISPEYLDKIFSRGEGQKKNKMLPRKCNVVINVDKQWVERIFNFGTGIM